ncbi:MAG TPA: 2-oxoglutarate ferredoxin oxidoreductase subunit alpha, partial [Vicinamibacteria bacterium]|nr:2-oxoglutarate ferredoxin oxidoreductase subunit alpha [Vicinamibacteria bacterium]
LFQAIFGRNSEAPLPVLAPATPGDCFWIALEACRIAIKYMTPVIILSDGYLANGAEPWRVPGVNDLPAFPTKFRTEPEGFKPFMRDTTTLARPWAVPGTPGLEHRIGGIEKQDVTGNINYEPENHDKMVRLRAAKVAGVVADIPDVVPAGDPEGDVVIVGWGSTCGSITSALHGLRAKGHKVGHIHLRHLNPMPKNLGAALKRYKKVLVPEINLGQLSFILRATYLVDAISYSKVEGKPFKTSEIEKKVLEVMK